MAKFGRELESKLRTAYIASGIAPLIGADDRQSARAALCARHDIPPAQEVVCVGVNASQEQQHLKILAAIAQMPAALRVKITVILPMAYPSNKDVRYVRAVARQAKDLRIDYRILEDFQTDAEMAQLRSAASVYINLPISDAFSVSMRESFLAGSIVITGSWLPYSPLRAGQVHYHEAKSIAALPDTLAHVLNSLCDEQAMAAENRRKLERFCLWVSAGTYGRRGYRVCSCRRLNSCSYSLAQRSIER